MSLLLLVKRIASKFMLLDNYCKRCGKKCETFTTEDDVYSRVILGCGERCFRCFCYEACERIPHPVWRVALDA